MQYISSLKLLYFIASFIKDMDIIRSVDNEKTSMFSKIKVLMLTGAIGRPVTALSQATPTLDGFVDGHAHPMSNLRFGGKLMHGAPDIDIPVPSLTATFECRYSQRTTGINVLFTTWLIAAALLVSLGAWAQEAADPEDEVPAIPAVEVSSSGSLLVVEPRVSGVATSVYVSCADGTYIHREFEGVGASLVELARADGAPVADGRCKYEVYVHPPVDREAMRLAEEQGDFATIQRLSRIEQEQTVISHGRFRVTGGAALVRGDEETDQ